MASSCTTIMITEAAVFLITCSSHEKLEDCAGFLLMYDIIISVTWYGMITTLIRGNSSDDRVQYRKSGHLLPNLIFY